MAIVAYPGTAPVAGAIVNVYNPGTEDPATIYADPLLTPLGNPFTADEQTGAYLFYAETAAYDIVVEVPAEPPIVMAAPAQVVFNGVSPLRVATLYAIDPLTQQQIVLIQVGY